MINLLKKQNESRKAELVEISPKDLERISGGHPGGTDNHKITHCPDGSVHIDAK